MRIRTLAAIGAGLVMLSAASFAQAVKSEETQATREKGEQIYDRACFLCHGADGKGDGPAGWFIGRYEAPRPRDFTGGGFKFRSTPSGELPTDQDLFRMVTQGIPGSMPAYVGLSEEERWQVIAYIKTFNQSFKKERPMALSLPNPPGPPSDAGIENGRKTYIKYGCQNCHGDNGYGDGKEALDGNLKDTYGLTISPGDLTGRTSLKGGSSAHAIYRTIMTGLNGTPMPSYVDTIGGNDKDVWDLVYYILSLSQERP
ncbi:MAG: c-type cytochrome [Nitrospira sp.]|nr:MAG: c-type cytochrome [Nitrospira sp.]